MAGALSKKARQGAWLLGFGKSRGLGSCRSSCSSAALFAETAPSRCVSRRVVFLGGGLRIISDVNGGRVAVRRVVSLLFRGETQAAFPLTEPFCALAASACGQAATASARHSAKMRLSGEFLFVLPSHPPKKVVINDPDGETSAPSESWPDAGLAGKSIADRPPPLYTFAVDALHSLAHQVG